MLCRLLIVVSLVAQASTEQWPYNRYHLHRGKDGWFSPDKDKPALAPQQPPNNRFVNWLHRVSETQDSGAVRMLFVNDTIPKNVADFDDLFNHLKIPDSKPSENNFSHILPPSIPYSPAQEAKKLFQNLKFDLDPRCIVDKSQWWYRTYDGSCNWLRQDEYSQGQIGTAKARDYDQHFYADGISKPRNGPNPRAVSNAFFRRNKTIYYEHTPLLLGIIEFIMHDITYSQDSSLESDKIIVSMPPDEDIFYPNTTFEIWRTQAVPGTGVPGKPRENVNMATTWLDLSSLYGSTAEVAKALRSFKDGKLLTQELRPAGQTKYASYLPYNKMNVPTRTRPGVDPETLFAGGDPRTNEDWLMLGVHTLMLREHNRLCDIVNRQHPDWDDERLYQTVRLVMSSKYALMANSYQMAYWSASMPWPRDDGFPLYRQMYGEDHLEINPMNAYPWPLVTKNGKPMVVSAEMAIVYRFHEFIISSFPIKDGSNNTIREQDVFSTGFNATGFVDTGLDNILRGIIGTHIPNFKSGVDEAFRSAGVYRGKPFDVVTWSIVHEREQGLPTFNAYFREYNKQDPHVEVPIRKTFKDFSKDPEVVQKLKKLYKNPDEVDLVVGVQLDEEMFPGTTVPKSAIIISLFSLFGMGNSDRFSIGFAMTRCMLVDTPLDCKPTNALEELLWAPKNVPGFPNARWYDPFWLTELDLQAHGTNLLWRLITENTEIKCLQRDPLFPADPISNPVLCNVKSATFKDQIEAILVSSIEGLLALYRLHKQLVNTVVAVLIGATVVLIWWLKVHKEALTTPPVLKGWPVLGVALAFQKDPKSLLLNGFAEYGRTVSKVFGLKLASLTHYVLTEREDLEFMMADAECEAKFNLHAFFGAINIPLITNKDNFESDLHTKLIRTHLSDPDTVSKFGSTVLDASEKFLDQNSALGKSQKQLEKFVPFLMEYITAVVAASVVGDEVFAHPDLLQTFATFNDKAIQAMGLASLLPKFLNPVAGWPINAQYTAAGKVLMPIIKERRVSLETYGQSRMLTFLDFILDAVDDDQRAVDLVVLVVWVGLTNLQGTLTSVVMDIINAPANIRTPLTKDLPNLKLTDLDTFRHSSSSTTRTRSTASNSWGSLRSSMFESLRLSGSITGPSRLTLENVTIPSSAGDCPQVIPKGQVATLSSYWTNRSTTIYGDDAPTWDPARFLAQDPDIGSTAFITWGLRGPHMCPGRWFAQEVLLVMTKVLLGRYEIVPDRVLTDEEKYVYSGGSVMRRDVGVSVSLREI